MRGTIALLIALLVLPARAEVVVRVRRTPGGPQIFVNNKPIAPRCFYGTRRGGYVTATTDWQPAAFEFEPVRAVKGTGTLHFRFHRVPSEFWLRKVRIVDVATGKDAFPLGTFESEAAFADVWNIWPPGKRNTVGKATIEAGALHVTLTAPPGGKWPDFHLHSDQTLSFDARRKYRCSFEVKCSVPGRVLPAVYTVEGGVWKPVGGPPGLFENQVALARDAGVPFVSTGVPACWYPPEEPQDWAPADKVMRDIIAVNPSALIIPRVGANSPGWWIERHPEARMMFEGKRPGRFATVSSRAYRNDAAAHFEKLCRHLCNAFPDNFAGIHPCGQNTGEWFYDKSWGPHMSGYEAPTRQAWRRWLRARGEPNADQADVPAAKARHAAPYGLLRAPARERELIEFNRFWQQEMADAVRQIAAACRRGTEGKKLVVFFYGYLFEFPPLGNGAPYAGHYALARVLDSTDIDVLCSPISYFDRQWQGTAPSMTAAESVELSGKLWLNEDDSRTYLDTRKAKRTLEGGLVNLAQTNAVMVRNTAQAALRGFGTWWMDLPGLGWFNDKRIWDELVRLGPLDQAMLERARPFTPDIAAILHEDSMLHLTGGSRVLARPLIYESRASLGRCGAPYGQYMLRDVLRGKVPAKLQVFLAAWALTPEQRQALKASRRPGQMRVWAYAPGYLLPDRADVAAMQQVSGFAHKAIELDSPQATPTKAGKALGINEPWGQTSKIKPLFTVALEPGDDVLATYSDGSASVVVRRGAGGIDAFVGTPAWTSALVRALAKMAGVHLYAQTDASIWAAEGYLSVHAMADGPLAIDTGAAAAVVDAFTGQKIGVGPQVSLAIAAGQTRLLKIR